MITKLNKKSRILSNRKHRYHHPVIRKLGYAGLLFIILLIFCTIFSNLLTSHDPDTQGDILKTRYLKPSPDHPFGTDKFGRDVFARVLYGGRISLTIAVSVVVLAIGFGVMYGALSGYFGGWIDSIMMRGLDFWLAFPAIFLIMTVIALFRPNHWYLIPLLSFTSWMETARIVRAEVLSVKTREFVLAATCLGFTHTRILTRHIIPHCLTPVIVSIPLKIGEMILLESALSFLGVGVQPPVASWGSIINDGQNVLLQAWWISTFPGIFIALTVMSFNLIGEWFRELFIPKI